MELSALTHYLDDQLKHSVYSDTSLNGLQVEGRAEVQTVALAVDASLAAIEAAIAGNADVLLTHHGLFWGRAQPLTGWLGQRIRRLMLTNMSLYTSHLPLDAHPELGNNAQLARVLGWANIAPFGDYKGQPIGVLAMTPQPLDLTECTAHIARSLAIPTTEIRVWGATKRPIRRIGIISGGAADSISEAIAAGCDAFLTGEPNYAAIFPAIEQGVPLLCAGHYHTETLGVQALGAHLSAHFGLQTWFVPGPTGI